MKTLPRLLSATALAAGLLATPAAHAVGRLLDVNVVDRDSGATLPVYRHRGDWWVAGRPGARYAVELRNAAPGRVLGVMAVDGINVISGDTASWQQGGYVLARGQQAQITGWRKSDDEVAVFHFTALPHSYAARTGRPDDVGVIGIAVFLEKTAPPAPATARPWPAPRGQDADARADAANAPAAAKSSAVQAETSPAQPQARLGTGHGAREASAVSTTTFERRHRRPDEIITLRYDSRENLVAAGIIAPDGVPPSPRPRAFPESARYVPDPPAPR